MTNLRAALCVVLCAGVAAGCAATTDNPTGAATPVASTLGPGERALDAGTYRIDLNELAAGGADFPPFLINVPEGWHSVDGWVVNRPRSGEDTPPVAVQFWDVDEIYGHPCEWDGTLSQPGPTVDDLASSLVDVPLRNATQPVDVTVDRYAGKYLEWSVPADIAIDDAGDFPECDGTDDTHRDFKSWTGKGWSSNRYHQGPGQIDRLWILDVDGARLVIDAFSMPSASAEDIAQLVDVVESIRFLEE